ncbi:MAG TPA: hypothetical protein VKY90_14855 [Candidatus Dormibacteraeota bacterium]|nr:hypothetical protein [Candidatus Dormibacteraeota bacterium]
MRNPLKVVIAGLGGLVVAVGVVVITLSAVGIHLNDSASTPSAVPAPAPSSVPSPPPAQSRPAARAVAQAVLQAEAQVLGMPPRQLTQQLRQGTTLSQLAAQKGIDQASFQAQLVQDVKPILDQDVQSGELTAAQEQQALRRLSTQIPRWSQATPSRATQ